MGRWYGDIKRPSPKIYSWQKTHEKILASQTLVKCKLKPQDYHFTLIGMSRIRKTSTGKDAEGLEISYPIGGNVK